MGPLVARLSSADLTTLATDRGSVPMQIGALLVLDEGSAPAAAELVEVVRRRVGRIPRLAERLGRAPLGCGGPYWEAAPDPPARQVTVTSAPADEAGLTDAAIGEVLRPLPRDRPLWRAVVYADARGRARAVVVVLHHVLADGVGGLAVLASLVDEGAGAVPAFPSAGRPTRRQLLRDAWARRRARVRAAPSALRGLVAGVRELGGVPRQEAEPSSLLRPTSGRRRVALVEVDLATLLAAARARGATLNDLLLVAVGGALGRVLGARGEALGEVVVSVPVSGRPAAAGQELGNQVGVLPITVPLVGDPGARLAAVREQRARLGTSAPRASSAAVVSLLFRGLAALGAFQWFIGRQRLVHTFLTNLRGPAEPLTLAGGRIRRMVPMALTPGNVTVSFDVLSYAGRLVVAVVYDPEHVPDHTLLRDALEQELGAAG